MEERLVELETRYTHLERQVAELSLVVFEQQKTIDRLGSKLREMSAQIEQQAEPQANDPPPHY